MATTNSKFSLENFSAVVTWAVVSGFSLHMMWQSESFTTGDILVAASLCLAYLLVWLFVGKEDSKLSPEIQVGLLVLLFFIIVGIYFTVPVTFVAIFMVIFSAITPYFMSLKQAFFISPLLALPLYLVYEFHWGFSGMLVTSFLFWTFNIFALIMVNASLREKEARLEAELSSRQLKATQSLLNEAVKQGERVRIARNIHDLLGHHLTALTINLQVAARKTDGEVKDSIEQCHQLAKLLLSDVREAVSDIRDKSKLDLAASIQSMIEKLPDLSVDLSLDEQLEIDDIQVADTILKTIQETITNTLKHAHGNKISVSIGYDEQSKSQSKGIKVSITNNGKMPQALNQGNGLTGIRERMDALKGQVEFFVEANRFHTQLWIPVANHD